MNKTKIEWCTHTLNPVIGCTYGCEYCYARKMNKRFGWIGDFSKPQFFPERLKMLDSKQPKIIFMDSMSDIADWENEWVSEVVCSMLKNQQHKYLFLTKRLTDVINKNEWWGTDDMLPVYFGVSVTNQKQMDELRESLYSPNFLSIEPIHEEINLYDQLLGWVIIGAETGNRKGKVTPKKEWIDRIVKDCKAQSVPVFMKDSLVPIMGEENMLREFPWQSTYKLERGGTV